MENAEINKNKKAKLKQTKAKTLGPLNDGMNTPVPGKIPTHIPSQSEAALIKQAENQLGDPNKV